MMRSRSERTSMVDVVGTLSSSLQGPYSSHPSGFAPALKSSESAPVLFAVAGIHAENDEPVVGCRLVLLAVQPAAVVGLPRDGGQRHRRDRREGEDGGAAGGALARRCGRRSAAVSAAAAEAVAHAATAAECLHVE